jgi:O-antigen ligase
VSVITNSINAAKYVSFTLVLTTIFILTSVSDPVNVTKFLVLGILSFGTLGFYWKSSYSQLWAKEKLFLILLLIFLSVSALSILVSKEPLVQNIYGVLGRNTGFFTYIFFILLLLIVLSFDNVASISIFTRALLIAGILNVIYGIWVRLFGDFIPWTNNYSALLGTFGNPDFAGAFLGILTGVLFSYYLSVTSKLRKILLSITLLFNLIVVLDTKTTQGLLIAAISLSVSAYFALKNGTQKWKLHKPFFMLVTIGGLVALLGVFQKGPLAPLLYKRSVSLRGVYWDAAFRTGNEHLFTGVGFDGFGNWYRQTRSVKAATWFPGEGVVTNVAHNIYLDIYASGGILLLITFLMLNIYCGLRLLTLLKKMQRFDWISVSLACIYFGYQAQALISINQIGLGIWGWTVLGAICAYERVTRKNENIQIEKRLNPRKIKNKNSDKSIVLVPLFMLFGTLIALPPFIADTKWTSALKFQDLKKLEEALKPSYFNPQSSERLANAVIILSNSNLDDKAYVYAKQGVEFSPNYFDGWKMLYYARKSTDSDRTFALENMKRLDPNNRTLDKLK